jgi:hypothetical protein
VRPLRHQGDDTEIAMLVLAGGCGDRRLDVVIIQSAE